MAQQEWTKPQFFLLSTTTLFVGLFVITTLGPLHWMPSLRSSFNGTAMQMVHWSAQIFFGHSNDFYSPISSDSLGLLIHCFNLLLLSIVAAFLFLFRMPSSTALDQWYYWLRTFLSYYIALQMLLYGFNKVFKYQFYLPEPNTLYTNVGEIPRDLLFWTVMGTAYGYTVFAGLLEVLAALLLLFRRTRLVGGLLTIILLANISAINFGFNISVKIYTLFYILFTGIILFPHIARLYAFLLQNRWVERSDWEPTYNRFPTRLAYANIKTMIVGLFLLESLYPYFKANNFNDDQHARPAFHGAYEADSFVQSAVSYPDESIYPWRWSKAFVHRRGYFVVQYQNGKTQDYEFTYSEEEGFFELTNTSTQQASRLNYFALPDGSLRLEGVLDKEPLQVFLDKLDWRSLPLLQHEFYWTIDEITAK